MSSRSSKRGSAKDSPDTVRKRSRSSKAKLSMRKGVDAACAFSVAEGDRLLYGHVADVFVGGENAANGELDSAVDGVRWVAAAKAGTWRLAQLSLQVNDEDRQPVGWALFQEHTNAADLIKQVIDRNVDESVKRCGDIGRYGWRDTYDNVTTALGGGPDGDETVDDKLDEFMGEIAVGQLIVLVADHFEAFRNSLLQLGKRMRGPGERVHKPSDSGEPCGIALHASIEDYENLWMLYDRESNELELMVYDSAYISLDLFDERFSGTDHTKLLLVERVFGDDGEACEKVTLIHEFVNETS
eukprot:CAMPEP_0177665262 /NCGR_PEP_ID=MMETSP0447-20121125/20959_1 /TAXON_ID=0 /ORGANISM="Stygamoeba regulata, Strain BSH-02190019" /LENGTH=298 /DNA_ID=CAMNT_0019171341 /DNA_START=278 /DNA_END=1174 /DNA_ORIENTATION=+